MFSATHAEHIDLYIQVQLCSQENDFLLHKVAEM